MHRSLTFLKFRFDGSMIKEQASSTYHHNNFSNLETYKGSPFVTGGTVEGDGITTEIYDSITGSWLQAESYPFATKQIWLYASISTKEAVYIIGGAIDYRGPGTDNYTSKIAKYQNGWTYVNDLAYRRYQPRAIQYDGKVMVIGGYTDLQGYDTP